MQVFYTVLLIIIGVLLFGFVVFFHELGHFLMAKLSGIRVNEFAWAWARSSSAFREGRLYTPCGFSP